MIQEDFKPGDFIIENYPSINGRPAQEALSIPKIIYKFVRKGKDNESVYVKEIFKKELILLWPGAFRLATPEEIADVIAKRIHGPKTFDGNQARIIINGTVIAPTKNHITIQRVGS